MNKAIKYRLYPTTEQAILFAKTFGCCRKIYNLMLADKIAYYEETGETLKNTPAQYKEDYPFLKEVDSLALANEQLHLQTAYKNFFRDKKVGFPKFKSAKHSHKTYTTNNQKGSIAIFDKEIKLPKAGKVKAVIHRLPNSDWKLKSATISQNRDGQYYVSILFEYEENITPISNYDNAIGLDYKSDGLYMDSNGNKAENYHKYYRDNQVKLAKAQRKLKNKTIGSNNYKKQQRKIAKIHKHTANQRLDYLHKLSTKIANSYDVVCIESINMQSVANKKNFIAKATLDNGYGMFTTLLKYKLADRGKFLVEVDKWYPSSQICSCCGNQQKLNLSDRIYKCDCGLVVDRDLNAAINILNEGLRILREEV